MFIVSSEYLLNSILGVSFYISLLILFSQFFHKFSMVSRSVTRTWL